LALSQRKTELLSLTDQLTGLPNRRSAIAAIQHAWAMSERAGLPLSIIMIDIPFGRVKSPARLLQFHFPAGHLAKDAWHLGEDRLEWTDDFLENPDAVL